MRKFIKFSSLVILVLISLIYLSTPVISASKKNKGSIDAQIAEEEKKRSDLAKQVEKYRKQIKEMGTQVEGLLTKVNTLQQDESVARQELTVLELQNKKIQENIDVLDDNIITLFKLRFAVFIATQCIECCNCFIIITGLHKCYSLIVSIVRNNDLCDNN